MKLTQKIINVCESDAKKRAKEIIKELKSGVKSWAEMMGNMSIRQKMLKLRGK